jgi:hypothetical protein
MLHNVNSGQIGKMRSACSRFFLNKSLCEKEYWDPLMYQNIQHTCGSHFRVAMETTWYYATLQILFALRIRQHSARSTVTNWHYPYTLSLVTSILHDTVIQAILTLILLMWRIGWAPKNASRWQMGFNSAFKGLIFISHTSGFPRVFITLSSRCELY